MEKVHQFISSHQQSIEKSLLCRLLQDLVRIPTVNPPGNRYPEMVDFLAPQPIPPGPQKSSPKRRLVLFFMCTLIIHNYNTLDKYNLLVYHYF